MAGGLGKGLQSPVHRFDSGRRLHPPLGFCVRISRSLEEIRTQERHRVLLGLEGWPGCSSTPARCRTGASSLLTCAWWVLVPRASPSPGSPLHRPWTWSCSRAGGLEADRRPSISNRGRCPRACRTSRCTRRALGPSAARAPSGRGRSTPDVADLVGHPWVPDDGWPFGFDELGALVRAGVCGPGARVGAVRIGELVCFRSPGANGDAHPVRTIRRLPPQSSDPIRHPISCRDGAQPAGGGAPWRHRRGPGDHCERWAGHRWRDPYRGSGTYRVAARRFGALPVASRTPGSGWLRTWWSRPASGTATTSSVATSPSTSTSTMPRGWRHLPAPSGASTRRVRRSWATGSGPSSVSIPPCVGARVSPTSASWSRPALSLALPVLVRPAPAGGRRSSPAAVDSGRDVARSTGCGRVPQAVGWSGSV